MLRAHANLLSRLLLVVWLAASTMGVLHAAEHALEAEQHACEVCVHANTGAAPTLPADIQLPHAPAGTLPAQRECAAYGQANHAHAPRGPPTQF